MSALTDLFTSMANKIRSKTGGSDTYTPTEMVSAVDDVYDAGYADATTPITPSNSSPASMTSGTGYKPTANGYAISSYREITPSPWQSGTPISSGDIIRFTGDGYAVPEDEEIAPRDVEAPRLDGRTHYFVTSRDGGYAVENQPVVIHPSDSHAVFLERGLNYNIMYSDGYAVESQPESKTPSDASPASVTSGSIVRPSAAGYLYATNHSIGACGNPSDVTGNAQTLTINTGLPSIRRFFIYYIGNTGNTANCFTTYNADISTTNYITYNSTNAYNKAIGTASGYAYAASVDSISGGTITLKTGANNAAAITNAWWVACS